jgi:hypothetical protein
VLHTYYIDKAVINRRWSITATSSKSYTFSFEAKFVRGIRDFLVPVLCHPVVGVPVMIGTFASLIFALQSIDNAVLGWSPADLMPEHHYLNRGYHLIFNIFSTFVSYIVFDVDVVANQPAIHDTIYELSTGSDYTSFFPSILSMYYLTSNAVNSLQGTGPHGWNDSHRGAGAQAGYGIVHANNATAFYEDWHNWGALPENLANATAQMGFFYADLFGFNVQAYRPSPVHPKGELDFLMVQYMNVGLTSEAAFIDMIKETNSIVEKSAIAEHTYITGPITTFWEAFIGLSGNLRTLMLYDFIFIFVATMLFFELDVVTAIITAVSCVIIVLQVYGICCAMMNFNIFVSAFVLMGMGMSVEFTCHLAAAFSTASGTPAQKMGAAVEHTFPALCEGIISTLLGVFPLFFHPVLFFKKYLFGIVSLTVGIGTLNGFVCMPAMLALLDNIAMMIKPRESAPVELNQSRELKASTDE